MVSSYIFGKFENALVPGAGRVAQARTVPAELSLFIFGFVYQLVLVWDALRLKNTIQIIGLCIYNVGLLVEAGVQYDQIGDAVNQLVNQPDRRLIDDSIQSGVRPYIIAVPCVLALGTILMSFTAWKLYDEFAWTIYKQISADLKLRKMYLSYQVREVLYSARYNKGMFSDEHLGLHCAFEVRLLLLPRFHRPIPGRGDQHSKVRARHYRCSNPNHGCHVILGGNMDAE